MTPIYVEDPKRQLIDVLRAEGNHFLRVCRSCWSKPKAPGMFFRPLISSGKLIAVTRSTPSAVSSAFGPFRHRSRSNGGCRATLKEGSPGVPPRLSPHREQGERQSPAGIEELLSPARRQAGGDERGEPGLPLREARTYAIVRHPGYAGGSPCLRASPCAWGRFGRWSLRALRLPSSFCGRRGKTRHLQAELPGYKDYTQRVRFKLIPGVR